MERLRSHATAAAAAATAATVTAALISAPPAAAEESPHSPSTMDIPAPDTWKPGKATTEPAGGKPPQKAWTPDRAPESPAAGAQSAEGPQPRAIHCESYNRGILDHYPMERHQISDRMELALNLHEGNAVLRHRDLTVRGTAGLDLSHNSFYDSNSWEGEWLASHGRDVGLEVDHSDGLLFHGPSGYCVNFDEDDDGELESPTGLNAELVENDNGTYSLTFDRGEYADQIWTFTADGWWISQTDRNGNVNRLRYNSQDRLASIVDSQDRATRFTHDDQGRLTEITDPVGETAAAYTYTDNGQVATLTDRAGQTLEFDYNGTNLTRITDATGAEWALSYNDAGKAVSLSEPTEDGPATSEYAYDGDQTTVTDPNGGESVFTFDDQGRQIEVEDQLGHTQSQEWTANSDVAATTDALDASVTYDYDQFNNLIGTQLPTGAKSAVGYADSANPNKPTSVTDPDGDQLEMDYDDRGNLTSARSEELDITVADIDHNGNGTVASVTDGRGNTTTYDYDNTGNMVAMDEPGPMGTTEFTYDSLSRVTSVTDGNGVTLEYGYDKLDRVVSISRDGELIQATEFDGNGNTTATHTQQAELAHTYDGRNDLLRTVRTDASGKERTTYGYDPAGNLTELTELGATTTYTYDAAFRLDELTDPTGATTAFDHDDNDRRTTTTHPDGATQSKTYDDSGRLASIEATNAAGETVTEASYSYDNDGSDSDQIQSTTVDGDTENYTYDALNRLTSDGETDYTYDDAGNLLSAGSDEFTYNDADQATTARGDQLDHDGAGNLIEQAGAQSQYSPTNQWTKTDTAEGDLQTSISYDTADSTQLRGITDINGDNRIDRQVVNTALGISDIASEGERTRYVRDPEGQLISMIDTADDTRFHYTTDYQNSVLSVTKAGSEANEPAVDYDYAPYGQTTTDTTGNAGSRAAGLNPFTYTGAYQFQNGTLHLGHRFFSPGLNQFTQPDPSRQERNNYTYAMCDPTNNTDPTGLVSLTCGFSIASLVIAGATLGVGLTALAIYGAPAAAGAAALTGVGAGLDVAGLAVSLGGVILSC